ncbi:hypothetical protein [Acutalibacter intestini]|uniref:hypothetical protein n=1 Tax=Acutalibacter intestini TaxID=3093659 RepID=UPI002AC99860|nr:hypothetical protein [Acutalibacter sp. M00204]
MQAQYLRIGKISSFNFPKGTARVTYEDKDGSTTAEFPFLSWQYMMPEVGDQVLVAHLSNGTGMAFILGPVWHDEWRPVEGFKGLYRKEYNYKKPGEAYERYDANTGVYKLQVGPCILEMNRDSGNIKITAPGNVTVNGDVIADGISLENHTHTGVHGETSKPH